MHESVNGSDGDDDEQFAKQQFLTNWFSGALFPFNKLIFDLPLCQRDHQTIRTLHVSVEDRNGGETTLELKCLDP